MKLSATEYCQVHSYHTGNREIALRMRFWVQLDAKWNSRAWVIQQWSMCRVQWNTQTILLCHDASGTLDLKSFLNLSIDVRCITS